MLVTLSISLSGCDRGPEPAANISFSQIGLCKGYDASSGPVTAGADEAFAIFKIQSVDNSKPAKGFFFDPALLYVDQSSPQQKAGNVWEWNRRFVTTDPRFAQALGVTAAGQVTVSKGEKAEINGFVVVPVGVNNPTGGPVDKQYAFDFVYDTGSSAKGEEKLSEGVVFTKLNSPATTSVVANCKALALK
ncbi:hypothetical protein [Methylocapsa aurea]|uniref:hypothetical protein n=1 Tax=Methylocapsa aurea TaxID=663610 RepID=UPI000564DC63|nr:hypothetical protein [Methylocapsa aurea]